MHLKQNPFDVAAIRMLAELAGRIGRLSDAEVLLRRAVELAPNFLTARSNLATVLYRQTKTSEALAELDALLAIDPENAGNTNLKAAALGRIGEYDEAVALYGDVLARHPDQPKIWMSYGHVLKTVGRQADSIDAYRRAISLLPSLGEVWWSLANLKTFSFDDVDLIAILDRGSQRNNPSVDFGSNGSVAQSGMDCIGKIYRRRPLGELDEFALRGKCEDAILIHRHTRVFEQFFGTIGMVEDLHQVLKPTNLPIRGLAVLLVGPMRRDSTFGLHMHVD